MKQLDFSIQINAPKAKVWNALWDDANYRRWTVVFSEGSHAEGDWKEGSKMLFLDGKGAGMSSQIVRLIPNELMAFQHLGVVQDGIEDFATAQAKGWSGAMEKYYLRDKDTGTELYVEIDTMDGGEENFADYFKEIFPKALQRVKEIAEAQKITPFLWFDNQAEEAANFYVSVFGNSKIGKVLRNGDAVMVVDFLLDGQSFSALNGGPRFQFNPSISFFVVCETEAETDAVWQKLTDGGLVMMPLQRYDWSEKYGWVQDRFGLSWQIALGKIAEVGQKFTPCFLFTGEQQGKAGAAVRFYTALFSGSSITGILPYSAGEAGQEGTVKHAQFRLCEQTFMAMDNPMDQTFTFNEAISFVVNCFDQKEVDYFWDRLTAGGGAESQCGWLKDKFGVSWQIIPETLPKLLTDPDPAIAQHAMNAMLQMRKIEIDKLTQANEDVKTVITVETTVNAPADKVWELWTEAGHIKNWNNASDDWHTPNALNDLRPGGAFVFTMAAKDGSFSFDFSGVYDDVIENQRIAYTMADGRKVEVTFAANGSGTHITETFDPENVHSHDIQRSGWQAILDNFKKYAEQLG